MAYWIFKVSTKDEYPDVPGSLYIYDNTHSVRVKAGDEFLYLEKKGARYGLAGAGQIFKVTSRTPTPEERRSPKVRSVFSAHLTDVVWFSELFDLSSQTPAGGANRVRTGLPRDLNSIGWSSSMPQIRYELFAALLDEALAATAPGSLLDAAAEVNWLVEDSWSLVRRRLRMQMFRSAVLSRHDYMCLICGCRLRSVLDAAHIRSYASDINHRANPANGICLCRFCHAAFDAGDIVLHADGGLTIVNPTDDPMALAHFTAVSPLARCACMQGVDCRFLADRPASQRRRQSPMERKAPAVDAPPLSHEAEAPL
jgi:hypothetical protein